MKKLTLALAASAAIVGVAAPAAAQVAYGYQQPAYGYGQPGYVAPNAYPQTGYGYAQPGYAYPQSSYGYQQGYQSNPISQIIDSLLGNRYQASDRQAVSQCASAAAIQAQAQYRGSGYGGYGYNQQNIAAPAMRVTAITSVQRRNNGLRVAGLMSSGYGASAYQNGAYAGTGDITFRCNVDYRGAVTSIRIGRNTNSYGAYGYRRY